MSDIKALLPQLAAIYECEEFLVGDPSWFMHQTEGDTNRELLAFIASSLSYGSRKQFMPKIASLALTDVKDGHYIDIAQWLLSGKYNDIVPDNDKCFYRLYNNHTFNAFLSALAEMVKQYGSIKGYLAARMQTREAIEAIALITQWFERQGSKGVIPKEFSLPYPTGGTLKHTSCFSSVSSCKRVCMFLRWMVRTDSPVDLGLWADIIDRRTLIIPMDTHVVQEAMKLGLLTSRTTSMSNAIRLSARLREFFPDDPMKGDFALFGYGVSKSK